MKYMIQYIHTKLKLELNKETILYKDEEDWRDVIDI